MCPACKCLPIPPPSSSPLSLFSKGPSSSSSFCSGAVCPRRRRPPSPPTQKDGSSGLRALDAILAIMGEERGKKSKEQKKIFSLSYFHRVQKMSEIVKKKGEAREDLLNGAGTFFYS